MTITTSNTADCLPYERGVHKKGWVGYNTRKGLGEERGKWGEGDPSMINIVYNFIKIKINEIVYGALLSWTVSLVIT